jgi:hypothetical protein
MMRVHIHFQVERVRVIKEIPVLLDQIKAIAVTAEENEALQARCGRNLKVSISIVANKGIRQ